MYSIELGYKHGNRRGYQTRTNCQMETTSYSKAPHTTQTLPIFGSSYASSIIDTLTKRTLMRPSSHTHKQTSPQTNSKQTYSTNTTPTSADYHTDTRVGPSFKRLHTITLDTNMTPPFTPTMTRHAIRAKFTSTTLPYQHLN